MYHVWFNDEKKKETASETEAKRSFSGYKSYITRHEEGHAVLYKDEELVSEYGDIKDPSSLIDYETQSDVPLSDKVSKALVTRPMVLDGSRFGELVTRFEGEDKLTREELDVLQVGATFMCDYYAQRDLPELSIFFSALRDQIALINKFTA